MATIKNHTGSPKKLNVFSFLKYEHLVAGISGGVTSTLILHPLDLIKIRFAGKQLAMDGSDTDEWTRLLISLCQGSGVSSGGLVYSYGSSVNGNRCLLVEREGWSHVSCVIVNNNISTATETFCWYRTTAYLLISYFRAIFNINTGWEYLLTEGVLIINTPGMYLFCLIGAFTLALEIDKEVY